MVSDFFAYIYYIWTICKNFYVKKWKLLSVDRFKVIDEKKPLHMASHEAGSARLKQKIENNS